ncbi:MAG: HlyD family efflux transporter periplasmic adaptor subunit [Sulfurospirillaceae bacterium]|nr:HlyD family efflux transporter periplasmic adaptor subunit [Sulfurospirillaceae bacterium]
MKKIGNIVILVLVLFFGYEGYAYLKFRSDNAVSDAAFIKSDSIALLSFKVKGKIKNMTKNEGDSIKKGEILARIDDKDFLVTLNKIKNSITSLKMSKSALEEKYARVTKELDLSEKIAKNNIVSYKSKIESLKLSIKANETKLSKLELDAKRYKRMLQEKLVAKNNYENILTAKNSLSDMILSQKQELDSVISNLNNVEDAATLSAIKKTSTKELNKTILALESKIKALNDDKEAIENKISYCNLIAPYDGIIAKKIANVDQVVSSGYPIYYVINPKKLHVEVLLSEKKLHGVKIGNLVSIKPDALDGKEYTGKVEKILPTSASTFSLVPRDIASGEFTKLDQRFTVRISLEKIDGLKVGMSANVAIKRSK